MSKSIIRVQTDQETISKAQKVFTKNNLTKGEAIELLFENTLLSPELPFPFDASEGND